jgi:hypothetical protein
MTCGMLVVHLWSADRIFRHGCELTCERQMYVLEANVRMDYQKGTEDGVGDWVERTGGEGREGQGNNAGRDDPVKIY